MLYARSRFWTAIILSTAVWLAALIFGGINSPFDLQLHNMLYAGNHPVMTRNAILLSRIGTAWVLVPLAIAAAIFLSFRRRMRAALLLIMVFGGRLLIEMQRVLVNRDRPGADQHLEAVSSMSFPSGHTANSMITFMAIALLVPVRQRYRAISIGIGLAMTLQIGWSRVALGVHWATDVLGGWAFGIFWITICIRLATDRPDNDSSSAG